MLLRAQLETSPPLATKRFRCAEVLFQPSFSASGIYVTEVTVSYNIFRYAEMLFQPITYELTDGKIITVSAKRFRLRGSIVPAHNL